MSKPILIEKGSALLKLGQLQNPPGVDCRVVAEELYQEIKSTIRDLVEYRSIGNLAKANCLLEKL